MKIHKKLLTKATNIFDRTLDVMAVIAGVLLVVATVIVGLGIFSRYFLFRPIAWVTEVSEYIILYIAFLVAAWVLRQEGHVKMDIVINYLNPKAQSIINIITSICCSIACLIITWYGIKVTWEFYKTDVFTYTVLELPKFIFTSVIFVGSFLLFIQFIRRAYGYLQGRKGPHEITDLKETGALKPRGED